jgi:hypothetical protein
MKHAVEMVLGAMIFITRFIKIGSCIQKQIARQHEDRISLLLFFFI